MQARSIWVPLFATLTMAACTFQSGIERSAIDYNEAADRVQKELLLKNVAPALSLSEGLTYTEIAEMRGSFTLQAETQLSVPFGGAAEPNFSITPKGTFKTNPQVVIKPLSTSEFRRGIGSSVAAETLLALWESGSPREVLLHVLVGKVVLTKKKLGTVGSKCPIGPKKWAKSADGERAECIFRNDPDEPDDFKYFRELLRQVRFVPFESTKSGTRVGPEVTFDQLHLLNLVAAAHDGQLVD